VFNAELMVVNCGLLCYAEPVIVSYVVPVVLSHGV
jgi:hypothetical protein